MLTFLPTRAGVLGITRTTLIFIKGIFSTFNTFTSSNRNDDSIVFITSLISLITNEYKSGLIDKIKISAF